MRSGKFIAFLLLLSGTLQAEVKLSRLFSDHAVFQRERPVRIWGLADPAEKVTVAFHDRTISTAADAAGMWEAWLRSEHAGGPYTLKVSGAAPKTSFKIHDVLVGDVWIASGQSNMQFPLKGFPTTPMLKSAEEVAAANHPNIRLLRQKTVASPTETTDPDAVWTECTPANAANFSAVAYFFARRIAEREHVAVGVIDATWGGTPAHAWISPEGLARENLTSVFQDAGAIVREQAKADILRERYAATDAALRGEGKPVPSHASIPNDHHGGPWIRGAIFNGMIAPDLNYAIKGVIWYQGESDGGPVRAPNSDRVFSALIRDWRRLWGQDDFPFLFVQLASYQTDAGQWGDVREGQRRALEVANTGMAVVLDVGEANNVHPPDKKTAGERLVAAWLGVAYGQQAVTLSPVFVQATTEQNAMRVSLAHAEGLTSRGKQLLDFEVAGEDRKFWPATASSRRSLDSPPSWSRPTKSRPPGRTLWLVRRGQQLHIQRCRSPFGHLHLRTPESITAWI
jgi:sialate O-acetylesterase